MEQNIEAIAKALGLEVVGRTFVATGAVFECNSEKFDTLHNYYEVTAIGGAKKKSADKKFLAAPL
jgi:hypothetical protein